jgi:outer membrane biosynthesis protein TonB
VGFIQGISRTFGKLLVIIALLATFLVGLLGVVWVSLKGDEVKVPQIIGKDVLESEKELASLGLKLKKRANRFSKENPNTILEQLPKPGETVKTGQTISVVISKLDPESTEEPATVDEDVVTNVTTAENRPKKEKKVEKKAATTRDVESNKSKVSKNGNSANLSSGKNSNSGKVENKNTETKPSNKSNSTTTPTTKPTPTSSNKPTKPAGSGDLRPRKIP